MSWGTFGRRASWNDLIWDWHYMRSIPLLYFLDIGPQSVLHSNCKRYLGVILYFRFLNIIFFHGWLSFLKEMELKESQKCKKNICFCPLGLLSVLFYFISLSSAKGGSLSLSEGMQYTVSPQFIDIFVYVLYDITVNDWWIYRTYFYFVTFHIYTQIYLY